MAEVSKFFWSHCIFICKSLGVCCIPRIYGEMLLIWGEHIKHMRNKTKKEWIGENSHELKEHSRNKRTKIAQIKKERKWGYANLFGRESRLREWWKPLFALARSFSESEGHRSRSQTQAHTQRQIEHRVLPWPMWSYSELFLKTGWKTFQFSLLTNSSLTAETW